MEYKIRVLDEAIQEVQEAIDWYSEISSKLSIDLEEKFYQVLSEITKHPHRPPKAKKIFRKHNIVRFPYNIIYKTQRDLITVVAFAHHKRKPNYWKKR